MSRNLRTRLVVPAGDRGVTQQLPAVRPSGCPGCRRGRQGTTGRTETVTWLPADFGASRAVHSAEGPTGLLRLFADEFVDQRAAAVAQLVHPVGPRPRGRSGPLLDAKQWALRHEHTKSRWWLAIRKSLDCAVPGERPASDEVRRQSFTHHPSMPDRPVGGKAGWGVCS